MAVSEKHAKQANQSSAEQAPYPSEGYAWFVVAILMIVYIFSFIDRQILALLKPMLDSELKWSNEAYGYINSAFQGAYALGLLGFGWFIDRFGVKIGYAVSILATSSRPSSTMLISRIRNFWILPVTVVGKASTNFQ